MALNIKDNVTERLAAEVAAIAGENKTQAIRTALRERRDRLALRGVAQDRRGALQAFLESEIWPLVPPRQRGRRMSRREEARVLGYGKQGV